MKRKIALHSILALAFITAAAVAPAKSPADAVNKNRRGVALKGYDPVGYFDQGKPVKGSPEFTHRWNGATWQFATAKNRDSFAASPEKYAPQYGGYCSWAVGHGYTADADPEAWSIVDGKLYLNYNRGVLQKWQPEKEKWIQEANKNWPGLHK